MVKQLRSAVRLRRFGDVWHKHGFSAAVALGLPFLALLATDRLDLILYVSAGSMCALYGHGLPYAARARAVLWVVLGMAASLAVALTASALTGSAALLVLVAALLAAAHKAVCDATRVGPPNNVVFTFIAASACFVPQQPGQVLPHTGLALAGGALAWLVCMAPALVRPHGPERIATARALESAARLLAADPARVDSARHATAAAVNAAWHIIFLVPESSRARTAARARAERMLIRAEGALAPPGRGRDSESAAEAARLRGWARTLRKGGPLPEVGLSPDQAGELAGVHAERAASDRLAEDPPRLPSPDHPRGFRPVARQFRPGSPLLPIGARVAVGGALAGWVSMALGVGHPYWAVVTAASVFQANMTLSWQRAVQRTLGNLLGLVVFTALLPLVHTGPAAMILLTLLFQIGAEAFMSRNYWLGTVCVTPMALLLSEFGAGSPAGELIADRWVDTLVGAVVGLLCCVLVTNRRATDRIEAALRRVAEHRDAAERSLADAGESAGHAERRQEAGWARDRLAASLIELREAADVASGEWWQRALPEERLALAEQEGHRTLARLVGLLSRPAVTA